MTRNDDESRRDCEEETRASDRYELIRFYEVDAWELFQAGSLLG